MNTRKCPICSDWIADDEPMSRQQVLYRQGRRRWARWQPVCLSCLEGRAGNLSSPDERVQVFANRSGLEVEPAPCAHCGLPVHLTPDARRKVPTCSDLCRSRHLGRARTPVEPAVTPTCEGCGDDMTGRADRRYCSSACRQRAYRRRTRLVRLGIAAEEVAHIDVFSRLDPDAFEVILERAREDGDLSAEHLAHLARKVLPQT